MVATCTSALEREGDILRRSVHQSSWPPDRHRRPRCGSRSAQASDVTIPETNRKRSAQAGLRLASGSTIPEAIRKRSVLASDATIPETNRTRSAQAFEIIILVNIAGKGAPKLPVSSSPCIYRKRGYGYPHTQASDVTILENQSKEKRTSF